MKKIIKYISAGTITTIVLILLHVVMSSMPKNNVTIEFFRFARPIRDVLFLPVTLIYQNTTEIYCGLTEFGLFDAGRCIVPTGQGLNMIEGEPYWFELAVLIISVIAMVIFYSLVLKLISSLKTRFHSTPNGV